MPIKAKLKSIKHRLRSCSDDKETLWAEVFRSTTSGSAWLGQTAFSPGRWAVGYPYLYALYRMLDEWKPQSILDIGLGQTTRMIARYAAAHPAVCHRVVEHDADWIRFSQASSTFPPNTEICRLEIQKGPVAGTHAEAWQYCDFSKMALAADGGAMKYELISVDAPFGNTAYARVDVLSLIPQALADSFAIIIDDCERSGEIAMVERLCARLTQNGIRYAFGTYNGSKRVVVIASEDLKFLTTL